MQLIDFLMEIPNSTGNCAFNVAHRAYISKGGKMFGCKKLDR